MLVLTLKLGQEIVIGDPKNPIAVVKVCGLPQGRVRLGVTAERSIPVNRREVVEKQQEKVIA